MSREIEQLREPQLRMALLEARLARLEAKTSTRLRDDGKANASAVKTSKSRHTEVARVKF